MCFKRLLKREDLPKHEEEANHMHKKEEEEQEQEQEQEERGLTAS